jgi:hypothetical protein
MSRSYPEQVTQWGKESVPGTAVAASSITDSATTFSGGPKWEVEEVETAGKKFVTGTFSKKEWTEWKLEGYTSWTDLPGFLVWAADESVDSAGVVDDTFEHVFTIGTGGTRTLERGDSSFAGRAAGCFVKSFGLSWGRNSGDAKLTAEIIGGIWEKGRTLTASPTSIANRVITAQSVSVFADSSLATIGDTQLTNAIKVEYKSGDIRGEVYHLNSSDESFASKVAKRMSGAELSLMIDNADGDQDDFIDYLRGASVKYIRIQALGAAIGLAGAANETFNLDLCVAPVSVEESDEDDVVAVTIPLRIVEDQSGFSHSFYILDENASA